MDPDAALAAFRRAYDTGEWEDAAHAAADLFAWLARGGFPPGWEEQR